MNTATPVTLKKTVLRVLPARKVLLVMMSSIWLSACVSAPERPEGSAAVRAKLTELQGQTELIGLAPIAMADAESAVRMAEEPSRDTVMAAHRVMIADRKVDTARAVARTNALENQFEGLADERTESRLDSRTREADRAHLAADRERMDAAASRAEANLARMESDAAKREAEELQAQIRLMNATVTDRGLVVTLGDVLFDFGKSDLKDGSFNHLIKLATFLQRYTDRSVMIEGHTDNIGSDMYNSELSRQRAESVKGFLVSNGVGAERLTVLGKGESSPLLQNDTDAHRQQNRRVEVIIADSVVAAK